MTISRSKRRSSHVAREIGCSRTSLQDLTKPGHMMIGDPADPQPPTRLHQFYRKEAVALEKVSELFE